jgi:hypothetical protein
MNNKIKFFLDTEFNERGRFYPLELLSIGIVCENGNELYLENADANLGLCNEWVQENVVPNLKGSRYENVFLSIKKISEEIEYFINENCGYNEIFTPKKPEFWGYFCDYDWVIFCQLFGRMIDLPKGFPYYCNDLKQLMVHLGISESLDELLKTKSSHNALNDAKDIKTGYDIVSKHIDGIWEEIKKTQHVFENK